MDRDTADQMLATIGAAYDRLSTGMYALDSHGGLGFLRAGVHTGATGALWAELRPRVDALWAQFSTLGDLLEEARAMRSAGRPGDPEWARLTTLLTAPVVGLDAAGMPEPSTVRPPRTAALRTIDLAARMEVACAAALRTLGDVNAAWTTASMASAPLADVAARAVALAADVNDPEPATDLARRVGVLHDQIVSDPVASAPHGVLDDRLRQTLAACHDEATALTAHLRAQARVRDGYDNRLAALTAAVEAVAAAEGRAGTAFARATAKVADTGLPDVPRSADLLRRELVELDNTRARATGLSGGWGRLAADADRLEQAATRAAERATELTAAADGLVGRRDELRGRLEAYRVKAAEHRFDEHDELAPLHRAARTLLYTAPCDLPAATRAVFAYQTRLAGLLSSEPGRKRS